MRGCGMSANGTGEGCVEPDRVVDKVPNKQNVVPCDNEDHRGLQFNLRGKQTATITVELDYAIRSWLITSFNFERKAS